MKKPWGWHSPEVIKSIEVGWSLPKCWIQNMEPTAAAKHMVMLQRFVFVCFCVSPIFRLVITSLYPLIPPVGKNIWRNLMLRALVVAIQTLFFFGGGALLQFVNEIVRPWCTPWKFNNSPLKMYHPKRKAFSSNHHSSGAILNFRVVINLMVMLNVTLLSESAKHSKFRRGQ